MIHIHGTPCGGEREGVTRFLRNRFALIPWLRPEDVTAAAEVCRGFVFDNSAFTSWKSGKPILDWSGYYAWVEAWRFHPGFLWAIIPDVIDGSEADNDRLLAEWPWDSQGVPVWHLHESLDRLERLCAAFPCGVERAYCHGFEAGKSAAASLVQEHAPLPITGITICKLPYQEHPFVHGAREGQDVWLNRDGTWSSDEGAETHSIPFAAPPPDPDAIHMGYCVTCKRTHGFGYDGVGVPVQRPGCREGEGPEKVEELRRWLSASIGVGKGVRATIPERDAIHDYYAAFMVGIASGMTGANHKTDCCYKTNAYRMWWMQGCIVGGVYRERDAAYAAIEELLAEPPPDLRAAVERVLAAKPEPSATEYGRSPSCYFVSDDFVESAQALARAVLGGKGEA